LKLGSFGLARHVGGTRRQRFSIVVFSRMVFNWRFAWGIQDRGKRGGSRKEVWDSQKKDEEKSRGQLLTTDTLEGNGPYSRQKKNHQGKTRQLGGKEKKRVRGKKAVKETEKMPRESDVNMKNSPSPKPSTGS